MSIQTCIVWLYTISICCPADLFVLFFWMRHKKLTKHGPKSNTLYKWNKDEKWRSFLISQQVILNKATAALLAKKNVKGLVTRQFFMKFWSSLLYSIIIWYFKWGKSYCMCFYTVDLSKTWDDVGKYDGKKMNINY